MTQSSVVAVFSECSGGAYCLSDVTSSPQLLKHDRLDPTSWVTRAAQ